MDLFSAEAPACQQCCSGPRGEKLLGSPRVQDQQFDLVLPANRSTSYQEKEMI